MSGLGMAVLGAVVLLGAALLWMTLADISGG